MGEADEQKNEVENEDPMIEKIDLTPSKEQLQKSKADS